MMKMRKKEQRARKKSLFSAVRKLGSVSSMFSKKGERKAVSKIEEFAADDLKNFWQLFTQMFIKEEDVLETIDNEVDVISESIMNVESMFVITDPKKQDKAKELVITNEDLLIKILTFLQQWKQHKADQKTTVFLIRALYKIIENKYKEFQEVDKEDQEEFLEKKKEFIEQ